MTQGWIPRATAQFGSLLRMVVGGVLLINSVALAAPPLGYYDSADTANSSTLRVTLHDIIDDHTRFPYTSSATDTWDVLEFADEDPNNASNILDVYLNASYPKAGGGNTNYNREHTWPKSYGFPNDNSQNYPYTDCHHLMLCDDGYNSSRSNKPYRDCDAACTEKATLANNGQGGGSGTYPGNSNWTSGSLTSGTWETWIGKRGDVARALLYMDVRYEGGTHGITGASEPDLILTDNEALLVASNTGNNESIAYMGILSELLQWHAQDPVDADEQQRNDDVFAFQGNRNPFVDHPEWVDCVFNNTCGGGSAPAAPTGLGSTGGDGFVDLDWNDNIESDLSGYNVYRATVSGGPYTQLNGALVAASLYTDNSVNNGTTYYYTATAVNTGSSESAMSSQTSATPSGGGGNPPGDPWINEIHYDNSSTDTNEGVEIAGAAGTDLAGWQIIGYNGNGGGVYKTVNLSGTITDQQGGLGTIWFAITGVQNGAPDGIALIDDLGAVVEFISYEGVLVAADGPAASMTSVNIGVSESSSTPVGDSLQLQGSGSQSADFIWAAPAAHTRGAVNNNQTFSGGGGCQSDPECDDGLFCNGAETCVANSCQPGTAVDCNDGVGCTDDSCNEATDSCDNVANDNTCDNGLYCDGAETCDAALDCQAGTTIDCNDGIGCTDDTCNEATDSCNNLINDGNCDDGLFCNGAEICDPALDCQGGSDPCPGQTCDEVNDVCVECTVDPDCDDGLFCNGAESCVGGLCQNGTAVNCSDGVGCTDDTCNEATDSCDNVVNDGNCDDGLYCNGTETCDAILDCTAGTSVNCGDGIGCTDDACNEATDSCDNTSNDGNCDDGIFCNGAETCDQTLDCQSAAPVNCDDGVGCTDDACNEATDSCDNVANDGNCDDGIFCNGAETCDPALDCQAAAPIDCDDGIGCTDDSCNEGTSSCDIVANDGNCDDGLFCNGAETCDGATDCQAGADPCPASCDEGSDTCVDPPGGAPWINEIHYDNSGKDRNEGAEVAGPAGTDLSGWQLVAYNGNGGGDYKTINLSGVIPDQQNGLGTLWFNIRKLQNGSPDGVALVDDLGTVIEFLSYEGTFTANGGPADGMTSTDIGVTESGGTPRGNSLQLEGTGSQSIDFTWSPHSPHTRGTTNNNQSF